MSCDAMLDLHHKRENRTKRKVIEVLVQSCHLKASESISGFEFTLRERLSSDWTGVQVEGGELEM